MSYNLLSVSKAVEKGYLVTFSDSSCHCVITNVNSKLITVASKFSGLYHLELYLFFVNKMTKNFIMMKDGRKTCGTNVLDILV